MVLSTSKTTPPFDLTEIYTVFLSSCRSQGQDAVTRVCVTTAQESRDEGLVLDRILWFNWIMDEPGVVVQPAIVMDSKADPLGLTRYSCMRGVEVCPFETILRAEFFYWLGRTF
jgi:hypothetical protein